MVEDPRILLANNMRRYRAERKWSQERLADEAGLHRTYIGAVERQEQNPSLDSIAKIAEALDVEVWQLLAPPDKDSKRKSVK
jgi:transcriptional regulator with XRE-family HTH domain